MSNTSSPPISRPVTPPVSPGMRLGKRFAWLLLAFLLILAGNAVNGNLKDYVQDVIQQCGVAIVLAVSLNIVNGLTGQFAIGHAGFMAVGAYSGASVTYFAARHLPAGHTLGLQWLLLGMVVGGLTAALFGYIVGVPSLRLRGDYLAIVTLGFGEIIRVLLENAHDISPALDYTGGATGFQNIPALSSFGVLFGTALLVIVVSRNLKFSSHGLAFLSVREDEIAADAMGVNTTRIKVTAFVLSAFFAGMGGTLFAHAKFFQPGSFGFVLSMNYVVMIVLGGTGSITGATLAAIVLTALPELLKPVKDQIHFTDEYRQVIYALLLVLMMILRPAGVFGTGELSLPGIKRWLNRRKSPVTTFDEGMEARERAESELTFQSAQNAAPIASSNDASATALDCLSLSKRFGGLTAVGDVNIRLQSGELVGLIGPNGAGKTTLFNLLTGMYEPSAGTLEFEGQPLAGERTYSSLQRGLRLTWDTLVAGFGGLVISTILSSAVLPFADTPDKQHLQAVIKWSGLVIGMGVSLATSGKRRRVRPGLKPYQFAQCGISRTFQNIRLFGELSVLDNVRVGMYLRRRTGLFDALLRTLRLEREEAEGIARARALLARFNLLRVENEQAKNLPYGDQRRLEIVRALATEPRLLLLDEPAAGMNPQEKVALMSLIREVRDSFGLTVLLIEHDMKLVMGICERIYVLDYGRIIAEGTPQEIRSNPKVIAAYLGEELGDANGDGVPDGEQAASSIADKLVS